MSSDPSSTTTDAVDVATPTSNKGKGMPVEELLGPTLFCKKVVKNKKAAAKASESEEIAVEYTIDTCSTKTALKDTKYLLLYFSASWCPPCQSFTPILSKFYDKHGGATKDNVEIIYISSDQSIEQFTTYFTKKMSFLYTMNPFSTKETSLMKEKRSALSKVFHIQGIPSLIVLYVEDGKVYFITNNGRTDILNYQTPITHKVMSNVWDEKITSYTTIEEGMNQTLYGGSIFSIMKNIIWTIIQNPLYVVGMIYVYKYLFGNKGQLISQQQMMTGNTATMNDNPLLEPVPDDEF